MLAAVSSCKCLDFLLRALGSHRGLRSEGQFACKSLGSIRGTRPTRWKSSLLSVLLVPISSSHSSLK